MARITYLLGAGASIDSLPVVDQFEEEISRVISRLQNFIGAIPDNIAETLSGDKGLIFSAIKELKMLREGCQKHRSVDTFAKMLFLTRSNVERAQKYRSVKCAIILFFELHRFFYNQTDKRYDAFLATIMSDQNPVFPKDINILSWNYDYEFERAYMNYCIGKNDIHEVYDDLNIIHKNKISSQGITDSFGIVKINGTAGYLSKNNEITLGLNQYDNIATGDNNKDEIKVLPFLKNHKKYSTEGNHEPAISFSWEKENEEMKIMNEIEKAVTNTEVLIIIGYSFPYFNRVIDRKILSSMRISGAKAYVQDPFADELLDTVRDMRFWQNNNRVIAIKNCNQFYLSF